METRRLLLRRNDVRQVGGRKGEATTSRLSRTRRDATATDLELSVARLDAGRVPREPFRDVGRPLKKGV